MSTVAKTLKYPHHPKTPFVKFLVLDHDRWSSPRYYNITPNTSKLTTVFLSNLLTPKPFLIKTGDWSEYVGLESKLSSIPSKLMYSHSFFVHVQSICIKLPYLITLKLCRSTQLTFLFLFNSAINDSESGVAVV